VRPPFRLNPNILSLINQIERLVGRSEAKLGPGAEPQLRRGNRIRTVQASVAIEGSRLSLDQVTAILDGRRVLGSDAEIREVTNAVRAYEMAPRFAPGSVRDLLRAHGVLMAGLIPDAGRWRSRDVGVIRGRKLGHVAPGSGRVPELMNALLAFVARDRETPTLVKACVAHYEIEFIHPFSDGNGRLGRLWQHVVLLADSPTFAAVPTESIIKARQRQYYATLAACDRAGDSSRFVEFSLTALRDAFSELVVDLGSRRPSADERLGMARVQFGRRRFSRRDYLSIHPDIGTATASRDLHRGVAAGMLDKQGHHATARYRFG
jgi:Fic family protein